MTRAYVKISFLCLISNVAQAQNLEERAKAILKAKCANCHQDKKEGGLNQITNVDKILETERYIVPGKPEKSKIIKRIEDNINPMPPAPHERLAFDDVATLKEWVDDLPNRVPVEKSLGTFADVYSLIQSDLKKIRAQKFDPTHARYLFVSSQGSYKPQDVKAIVDLSLNSLSGSDIPTPSVSLHSSNRLLRIWLPRYHWDKDSFDATLRNHQESNWLKSGHLSETPEDKFLLATITNVVKTETPIADAFAFFGRNICVNEAYTKTLREVLLRRMNYLKLTPEQSDLRESYVDTLVPTSKRVPRAILTKNDTLRIEDVSKAPDSVDDFLPLLQFQGSKGKSMVLRTSVAISQYYKEQQVEVQRGVTGIPIYNDEVSHLWMSHDFQPEREIDLFNYNKHKDTAADSHEVIFSLPNGFQAFLTTGKAPERKLLAEVPGNLSRRIENPSSCFGCHAKGYLPRDDERAEYQNDFATLPKSYSKFLFKEDEASTLLNQQNIRLRDAINKALGTAVNRNAPAYDLSLLEKFCSQR